MTAQKRLTQKLEQHPVAMSAPCRLDMGGTLDISTFFFPLKHREPTTFNIALDMRTTVTIRPFARGRVKISSRGFESLDVAKGRASYKHPLGLMLCICDYFDADGVHVDIDSASPPRSALGGSSVAAVGLIAALMTAREEADADRLPLDRIVLQAYAIESSVLRMPCGMQDQLAAAYGGINAWRFTGDMTNLPYERRIVLPPSAFPDVESCMIAAYGGVPHESVDINGRWVDHFIEGRDRGIWEEIITCCTRFSDAVAVGDFAEAARLMNRETDLRLSMTPDVLDETGAKLTHAARKEGCGGRFTGAGGGGCVWALGEAERIKTLKTRWADIVNETPEAGFLDVSIAREGLRAEAV